MILPLVNRLNGYGTLLMPRLQKMIGTAFLNFLYVHYDMNRDFMEQFHENAMVANRFLDTIDETVRQFDNKGGKHDE